MLFIGLSAEVTVLSHKLGQAEEAAVHTGGAAAQEDGSPGYRLSKDPAARRLELTVRRYALRHEAELLRVLESSSDAEQRAIAADALGYWRRSPKQTEALGRASRDPDDGVRNNASFLLMYWTQTRDPELLEQLQAQALDALLGIARWRDTGHAVPARLVLGRIAGIPEDRLWQLASGDVQAILDALRF